MARALRIEMAGGVYHVLGFGNYRKPVFSEEEDAELFEQALVEAAARCGWRVHAHVLMPDHFHLAVETPEPNLVPGMQWLQGTFANRFNRRHGERGHVFQGRYKALLVEPGDTLVRLVDYLHLNPVRSRKLPFSRLSEHRWSSLGRWLESSVPNPWIRSTVLGTLGLPDSIDGARAYVERLKGQPEGEPARKAELSTRLCRGWLIGSREFRERVLQGLGKAETAAPQGPRRLGPETAELREAQWRSALQTALASAGRSETELAAAPKTAAWKVEIARTLRAGTTASNVWIAAALHMGHASRVCQVLAGERTVRAKPTTPWSAPEGGMDVALL